MDMAFRRPRVPIGWIVAIAFHGACKSNETPPSPPSAPDLQIVSAGGEPRELLRYRPVANTTQKLEVTIDIELDAGDMGGPMPTLVMTLAVNVGATLPTGQTTIRATIEGIAARDVPDSQVAASSLGPTLEPMKGIAFDAVLSPNGRLTGTSIEGRAQKLPTPTQTSLASLVNSFEQTLMPLPDVPVGPGAVWRNSRPITRNGMTLTAVNSVTLVSKTGSSISYTIDSTLHGADQSANEGSDTVDVKDITGTGGGMGTVDLTTLAVTSEITAELRTKMSAAGDAEPTPLTMATVTRVKPL